MNIYIHCKTDAGIIQADSAVQLQQVRILDRQGNPVPCPMFREQKLNDGTFRYRFDASELPMWKRASNRKC